MCHRPERAEAVNRGRRGVFVPDLAAKPAPLVVVQPAGVLDAVSEKPFGTVANRCTPDAASIPWLSLSGVPTGPGIFAKVTFIQRLNTASRLPRRGASSARKCEYRTRRTTTSTACGNSSGAGDERLGGARTRRKRSRPASVPCTRIRCPSRISRLAFSTRTTAGNPYSRTLRGADTQISAVAVWWPQWWQRANERSFSTDLGWVP
jgi:hypothetical protein